MRKKRRGVKVGNVMWSPPFRRFSPGSETPQPLERTNISNLSHCKPYITCLIILKLHQILSAVQDIFKILHISGVGVIMKTLQIRGKEF
jgi:hypothetical protein